MSCCMQCGCALTSDDIAIHRKLISREATVYMCKDCLAHYFSVDISKVDEKIAQFKRQGCLLFEQDSP